MAVDPAEPAEPRRRRVASGSPEASHALPLLVRDLSGGYGALRALEHVDLEVARGEIVGVVGPSGAGKTTLLRLLTGQADRHAGRVEVAGQRIRNRRAPRRVGLVPQLGSVDWDFPLTVEQAVLLGLSADSGRRPWFSRSERARARELLDRLGLDGLAQRPIRALSGGQRQRMFLARAMIRDADVLLLDEPTSGVDVATRAEVLGLVGELAADGLAVLITTHDLNWVAAHLPRLLFLNQSVVADGPPREVLTPEVLRKTYEADLTVIHEQGRIAVVDEQPLLGSAATASAAAADRAERPPWTG